MTVRVLDADPDLGADLDDRRAARARELSVARVVEGRKGRWDEVRAAEPARGGFGRLAAARRPSISESLTRLTRRGVVRREGRAWILVGDPP